jgi:nickel/cobalt transporter (NicO) family protein
MQRQINNPPEIKTGARNFMLKYFLSFFAVLTFVVLASAHPLGNFSVNQYSRLSPGAQQVKLRQVLDIAEIPTFQLQSEIDSNKDGRLSDDELAAYGESATPRILANLVLTVDGRPVELRAEKKWFTLREGAGGLPTLRAEIDFAGDLQNVVEGKVHFENRNNPDRLGWNEVVVSREAGVAVFDTANFGSAITDELNAYPQETLDAPLRERSADFTFTSGALPAGAKPLQNRDGHVSTPVQKDRLAELISVPQITFPIALFGLLVAFGLGAIHALSPGHGKTVVGAYLVGSRGTAKHAAFLGLTVTITHTLGVFALGLITLFASNYILPERMMPFLSFVSGLLVFFIGISLFNDRLFGAFGWSAAKAHHHHHDTEGEHTHDGMTHTHDGRTHSHAPPAEISWKNLLALGISGGLLPCPSALVLMLSAISLGRVGYGLILTFIFSSGLAATLTGVGLLFLFAGKAFGGTRLANYRLIKVLPVMSAFVIACVGAVICYQSLA